MQGKSDPNRELLDAAALCRQLVPEGSVEAFLADHRHQLFPDEVFADLFPSGRGRPSIPAEVIATAMVLQSLEGLSDREAARAVRDRISWKVACGLALDDEGFDYSVLTYWRTRLRHSDRPERIFDAVRSVIDATGVLAGRRRRALDSTILDDAVATQDTVTQLISAIRRVRRLVPEAAEVALSAHDYDTAAKPLIAWDDPVAKQALITALVADALALVAAVEGLALSGDAADAVGLLALVAGQDVEPGDEPGTWRIARRVAPDRVISTVDPEARHTRKSPSQPRDGYKAHVAVEPETGLITDAALTAANVSDAKRPRLVDHEEPAWRCSATPPMAPGACGPSWPAPAMPPPSSPCRHGRPSPAGSAATTSTSTTRPTRSPARPETRPPSGSTSSPASAPPVPPAVLRPLHHLAQGSQRVDQPLRHRAGGGPPPGRDRGLPTGLPAVAADGRAGHRLVGGRRQPPAALPGRCPQPPVAHDPHRRAQPPSRVASASTTTAAGFSPGSHEGASPVSHGGNHTMGIALPGRPACTLCTRRFGSSLPGLAMKPYERGPPPSTVSSTGS